MPTGPHSIKAKAIVATLLEDLGARFDMNLDAEIGEAGRLALVARWEALVLDELERDTERQQGMEGGT